MDKQLNLTLPDQLYTRVQQWAQARDQQVDQAIIEYLDQALPQTSPSSTHATREREKRAFVRLHAELWEKYPHEYVAIYQEQVIDHDKDEVALMKRIDAQYPDVFVLVRPVRETAEIVYQFRSPRLIPHSKS